jgi:hypothetical protein
MILQLFQVSEMHSGLCPDFHYWLVLIPPVRLPSLFLSLPARLEIPTVFLARSVFHTVKTRWGYFIVGEHIY